MQHDCNFHLLWNDCQDISPGFKVVPMSQLPADQRRFSLDCIYTTALQFFWGFNAVTPIWQDPSLYRDWTRIFQEIPMYRMCRMSKLTCCAALSVPRGSAVNFSKFLDGESKFLPASLVFSPFEHVLFARSWTMLECTNNVCHLSKMFENTRDLWQVLIVNVWEIQARHLRIPDPHSMIISKNCLGQVMTLTVRF